MRRCFLCFLLIPVLVLGACSWACTSASAASELTGVEWIQSSQNEKLAFLYGVSNVVAIEQLVAEKQGSAPSPFVRAWLKAFDAVTLKQLQALLDDWYASHPEDADRQVFDVLWWEYMLPADK